MLYTRIWTGQKSTRKNLSFDYSRFQTVLFSLVATAPINLPPPTPLNWKTGQPMWIEQWPLKQTKKKKMEALHELVNEQLNKRHIIESTLALGILQCSLHKRSLVNGECLLI